MSLPGRSEYLQDGERDAQEDGAGERGSDESNDVIYSRNEKDCELFED